MKKKNTKNSQQETQTNSQQEETQESLHEPPSQNQEDTSLHDATEQATGQENMHDEEKREECALSSQQERQIVEQKKREAQEVHTIEQLPHVVKAKEYAHEGISMLRQFMQLLFSFITALFPNLADIFKWSVFKKLCIMIRIEHTVFALPFAYIGLLVASKGSTNMYAFILVTLAMFGIRSFAMTVNRIVDVTFDSLNPRTQHRELVTGEITMGQAKAFAFVSLCIFIAACALINTSLLALAPIPILFSAGYSYMKRVTWYCHFILGGVLALAPIAGELAILGSVTGDVLTLAFGILFWVAGFDILYACQDADFDKEHNLYSIPSCFGIPTALLIAKLCHVNTLIFFFLFGFLAGLNFIWYCVWTAIAGLLLWEHHMLSPTDLSKINHAFFTINSCIAIAVFIGVYFA